MGQFNAHTRKRKGNKGQMKLYLHVTEVAIEHNEKFLIIKRPEGKDVHAGGLLSFPGGKVEEMDEEEGGQDILKVAARREVQEEVGLELKDELHYVLSAQFRDKNKEISIIDSIFYCKLEKTIVTVKPSSREVPEYYWMSSEEIYRDPRAPEWLKTYIQKINSRGFTSNFSLNT